MGIFTSLYSIVDLDCLLEFAAWLNGSGDENPGPSSPADCVYLGINQYIDDMNCLIQKQNAIEEFGADQWVVDELENMCGCPLSESLIDFETFDPSDEVLEEEPKWGQLGNCDQIKNEINNAQLSGSILQQAQQLDSYFDCNVFYTRENGSLVYDDERANFCKVKKYLYTEKRGWIDYLHVFRIFAWCVDTYENSNNNNTTILSTAISVELTGYTAEAWQWAKDNYSAFSYEDLGSNHIGALLFINQYENLVNGETCWVDLIQIVCDEFDAKNPDEAPNYRYIPYLIDGTYPKIFNPSHCLTGQDLKDAGKNDFCKQSLENQIIIIEAHYAFPH